jgi:hypothetical protein
MAAVMYGAENPTGVTGRDGDVINKAASIAAEVWRAEVPPPEVDSDLLIACILYTAIRHQRKLPEDRRDSTDLRDMLAILMRGYPEYVRGLADL